MASDPTSAVADHREETRIPIIRLGDHLIVSVQVSLQDRQALNLQEDILSEIRRTGVCGLILDISSVPIMDSYIARILNDIARNALLMGARTVVVGMSPPIAITLVTMGMEFQNIQAALNLDAALELLREEKDG